MLEGGSLKMNLKTVFLGSNCNLAYAQFIIKCTQMKVQTHKFLISIQLIIRHTHTQTMELLAITLIYKFRNTFDFDKLRCVRCVINNETQVNVCLVAFDLTQT